jgi:hypothetical protein
MKGIVQKFVLQRVEVSGDEQRARKCEARSERKWIGKGKGKDTRAMFRITVAVGASTGFCTCIVLKVLLATYSRFREKSTFIQNSILRKPVRGGIEGLPKVLQRDTVVRKGSAPWRSRKSEVFRSARSTKRYLLGYLTVTSKAVLGHILYSSRSINQATTPEARAFSYTGILIHHGLYAFNLP